MTFPSHPGNIGVALSPVLPDHAFRQSSVVSSLYESRQTAPPLPPLYHFTVEYRSGTTTDGVQRIPCRAYSRRLRIFPRIRARVGVDTGVGCVRCAWGGGPARPGWLTRC